MDYLGNPKLLEMSALWDTCQGSGTSPREKCVAVNKAERSWRSEEHFEIRHGDAELVVYLASFWSCFGPVFPHYVPFSPFCDGNVYPGPLYVRSI